MRRDKHGLVALGESAPAFQGLAAVFEALVSPQEVVGDGLAQGLGLGEAVGLGRAARFGAADRAPAAGGA